MRFICILTHVPFGGYALINAACKEEAVDHARSFLEHGARGTWEIYQLFEMPADE